MSNINSDKIISSAASSRFCACMALLSTKANFCHVCGKPVRCSSCKADILEPNAIFCSECGNPVSVPMASTQSDEAKLSQAVNLSMTKLHVQKSTLTRRHSEWNITSIITIVLDRMLCQKNWMLNHYLRKILMIMSLLPIMTTKL